MNSYNLSYSKINDAMSFCCDRIEQNLKTFTHIFPGPASVNNVYQVNENIGWTPGFWTGMNWLAYQHTKNDKFLSTAKIQCEDFRKRLLNNISLEHHDIGFLYEHSCIKGYEITGDTEMKKTAIMASEKLTTRFQEKGGFIQAWGELGKQENYRLIIDCFLNLPLLFWASDETKDSKYYDIAYSHANAALDTVVREDASTYHTYYFDNVTGAPLKGVTHQGYKDDSTWARGQAWAIYGLPLVYKYTGDERFLEKSVPVTEYFLNELPKDYVCYWDLSFKDGSNQVKDSSAAAIAVCGMIEALKYLKDSETIEKYKFYIGRILESLIDNYTTKNIPGSNGLLAHGVYNWNKCLGVDECNLWGDYYFMEALSYILKSGG